MMVLVPILVLSLMLGLMLVTPLGSLSRGRRPVAKHKWQQQQQPLARQPVQALSH